MCAHPTYKVVDDHMRGSLIGVACQIVFNFVNWFRFALNISAVR
jgi:hypothetical protein